MKVDTTLFNRVLRQSFSWEMLTPAGAQQLRRTLNEAHRFVLDDDMSKFLGHLSCSPFVVKTEKKEQRDQMMNGIIRTARLPHKTLWVEINLLDFRRGIQEAGGPALQIDLSDIPLREGWLIETHPYSDENFRVTLFLSDSSESILSGNVIIVPASMIWTVIDGASPLYWPDTWKKDSREGDIDNVASRVLMGLPEYNTKAVTLSPCLFVGGDPTFITGQNLAAFFTEWAGVMRRILVFLATITDMPIVKKAMKPSSKKFLAKGSLRSYLDYDTLTLNVPERRYSDHAKLAKEIMSHVHRRAHMVRGHWRHISSGKRIWIKEHQRGDATLGFVKHTYEVTHREEREEPEVKTEQEIEK